MTSNSNQKQTLAEQGHQHSSQQAEVPQGMLFSQPHCHQVSHFSHLAPQVV